jgi:hypothetical protein
MAFRALALSFTDQRGTTAIEFAIVAPLFLALAVGTLYLGICLFMVGSLHYTVEEAARCASVRSTGDCSTSAKVVVICPSPVFRTELADVHPSTGSGLRQFGDRIGQLFAEFRDHERDGSAFGDRLLSIIRARSGALSRS